MATPTDFTILHRLFTTPHATAQFAEASKRKALKTDPRDEAVWYMGARAVADRDRVRIADEFDFDIRTAAGGGAARTAAAGAGGGAGLPRPGTSHPHGVVTPSSFLAGMDPSTSSHAGPGAAAARRARIATGYLRPVTAAAQPGTRAGALRAATGVSSSAGRMTTSSGRLLRLGTGSLMSDDATGLVDLSRIDLKKYATNAALSRVLFDYIYNHLGDVRKALELASHAVEANDYKDWWWKLQIARCFLQLHQYQDAEKHLKSSIKDQDTLQAQMYLGKLYVETQRYQQAIETFSDASRAHPEATHPLRAQARLFEQQQRLAESSVLYKQVLLVDGTCLEAMACLASNYYHTMQPEVAHRYYLRIIQTGHRDAEVFNNLALAAYASQQFDEALPLFEE
ncbi:hypothetical protein DFJ73DRAFT_962408, partial [Zopfochytrium polystomum]